MVKNLPAVGETQVGSLGQEDSLEKGMATYSQEPCLENSMDRGVWWATVHGITESDMTKRLTLHFHSSDWKLSMTPIHLLVIVKLQ